MRRMVCAGCGERVQEPALSIHRKGAGLIHYCLHCADEVTGHKLDICAFCTQYRAHRGGTGRCVFHNMIVANRETCKRFERREVNENTKDISGL